MLGTCTPRYGQALDLLMVHTANEACMLWQIKAFPFCTPNLGQARQAFDYIPVATAGALLGRRLSDLHLPKCIGWIVSDATLCTADPIRFVLALDSALVALMGVV